MRHFLNHRFFHVYDPSRDGSMSAGLFPPPIRWPLCAHLFFATRLCQDVSLRAAGDLLFLTLLNFRQAVFILFTPSYFYSLSFLFFSFLSFFPSFLLSFFPSFLLSFSPSLSVQMLSFNNRDYSSSCSPNQTIIQPWSM